MAQKCAECRSTDVNTCHSDVVCCLNCGHTGNKAGSDSPEPAVNKTAVPEKTKAKR